MPLLGLVRAQRQFTGEHALMGHDYLVLSFGPLYYFPGLPPVYHQPQIQPVPELIADIVPFVSEDLSPRDTASVDFLQFGQHGAGILASEPRNDLRERMATNRFTSNANKAIDEKSAAAHL